MNKIIFVVECVRYDDRDNHTYTCGIYDNELLALKQAWAHMKVRAGKYGAEVTGYILNTYEVVYKRKLSCWDAFAASCSDTADKLKKMLEEDGSWNDKDTRNPEDIIKEKELGYKTGDYITGKDRSYSRSLYKFRGFSEDKAEMKLELIVFEDIRPRPNDEEAIFSVPASYAKCYRYPTEEELEIYNKDK